MTFHLVYHLLTSGIAQTGRDLGTSLVLGITLPPAMPGTYECLNNVGLGLAMDTREQQRGPPLLIILLATMVQPVHPMALNLPSEGVDTMLGSFREWPNVRS